MNGKAKPKPLQNKDCPFCGNHVFPAPTGYFCNECGAELSEQDVITLDTTQEDER